MRTVIAAKTHTLVSFRNEELLALANSLTEILHNSDITEADATSRLGAEISDVKALHRDLIASIALGRAASTEIFDMWKDGYSLQLKAISVFGDPADLSFDEVRIALEKLKDEN